MNAEGEAQKQELLKCLQQVAELVQGNWVVKSEVLYPGPEKDKPVKLCGLSGIHPDIMSKARDYLVRLFIFVSSLYGDFMCSCFLPTVISIFAQSSSWPQCRNSRNPDTGRRDEGHSRASGRQERERLGIPPTLWPQLCWQVRSR